jgi:hypothetical protein
MKKKKYGCAIVTILLAGGMLVVALVAYYMFAIVPGKLEEIRVTSGPPSVLSHTPVAGETFLAGTTVFARATATGLNPISEVELWVDGELIAKLVPEEPNQNVYQAFTDFQISEGTHLFFWRVIDSVGLVGQNLPIAIAAESLPVAEEPAGSDAPDIANPPGGQGQPNPGGGDTDGGAPQGDQAGSGNEPPPVAGAQEEKADIGDEPPPEAWIAHEATNIDWSRFNVTLNQYPKAPSNLQVGFENCRVKLMWNDNADNETRFDVWIQAFGGPPVPVKKLDSRPGTGQAWFEFDPPPFGIYSVWVEAVNALGGQSSEIQGVAINQNCSEDVPTHLEIEALRLYGFNEAWENIYCYVSLEGAPEERIPEGSGFLELDTVQGADIHTWVGGRNRRLVPIPDDGVITIEGKCMGWLGDNPQAMDFFSESVPKAYWDGRLLQFSGANLSLDYQVRTYVFSEGEGVYEFIDEGLPEPSIYQIKVGLGYTPESNTPEENAILAQYPKILFTWDGDPRDITGFTLYVDGTPHFYEKPQGPFSRFGEIPFGPLPTACGGIFEFQVAANTGQARSRLSNLKVYEQSPCRRFAELTFEGFNFAVLGGETLDDCVETKLRVRILGPKKNQNYIPVHQYCVFYVMSKFRAVPNRQQHIGIGPGGGDIIADVEFVELYWNSYYPICTMRKIYRIPAMSDADWGKFYFTDKPRCPNVPMDNNGSGPIYITIRGYFGVE